MDRLLRMILNMVLRKGANHMIRQAGKRGQNDDDGKPKGPGGGGGGHNQSVKRAQQALRAGRKIGRF